jgi:3-phenylpropionate/trans-cinnamate dioxygenase ferredoxin reductase subunit
MTERGVVIVGAGQAGVQAAASLRELGFMASITLVNGEGVLPYQRPPLSKAFMLGKVEEDGLRFRNQGYFERNSIVLVCSDLAVAIDRPQRRVQLASGETIDYDHLILATGARNRTLPVPGSELSGVHYLRSIADAAALRERLRSANNVVVIGGGFIGMEFAAVAAKLDTQTHVVEASPRIMARAVSPEVSAYFTRRHMDRGTTFSFDDSVVCINGTMDKVVSVETARGGMVPADMVLIGIGVVPNEHLAEEAGLDVANGIVVDDRLITSDPAISAIGDCAMYPSPFGGGMLRLESVQNAVDQGRAVAARLTGKPSSYAGVPWFWSDQGDDKLQIVGIARGTDLRIVRGNESEGRFSVFFLRDDALVCVESVNRVADHMAARALLKSGDLSRVTTGHVLAVDFELKSRIAKEAVTV